MEEFITTARKNSIFIGKIEIQVGGEYNEVPAILPENSESKFYH